MTRKERLKLAKAARELASDFAEGRGPEVTNGKGWCGCIAGHLVRRANGYSEQEMSIRWVEASIFDSDGYLTHTTSLAAEDPGAAVFPLLALADEMEAQR